jgi:hypothetical protein
MSSMTILHKQTRMIVISFSRSLDDAFSHQPKVLKSSDCSAWECAANADVISFRSCALFCHWASLCVSPLQAITLDRSSGRCDEMMNRWTFKFRRSWSSEPGIHEIPIANWEQDVYIVEKSIPESTQKLLIHNAGSEFIPFHSSLLAKIHKLNQFPSNFDPPHNRLSFNIFLPSIFCPPVLTYLFHIQWQSSLVRNILINVLIVNPS